MPMLGFHARSVQNFLEVSQTLVVLEVLLMMARVPFPFYRKKKAEVK